MADSAVQTAIYKMGADTTEYVRGMAAADAANDKVAGSTERVTQSEEKVGRATRATVTSLERRLGRLDPLIRAEQEYQRNLAMHARFEEEQIGTAMQRANFLDLLTSKYNEQTAAIQRNRAAASGQIIPLRAGADALEKIGVSAGEAAMRSRQLSFQLVDIGQALATAPTMGIYALQNLGFQIAQIGQLYLGQGGFNQAIKDSTAQIASFIRYLGPLGTITAGLTVAFGGLVYEIKRSTDATVSFGDIALGVFQTVRDGIYGVLKPAIDAIAPWFQMAWDGVVAGVKTVGNLIINSFRAAFVDVSTIWTELGNVMGAAMIGATNAFIRGLNAMIEKATAGIDWLIEQANKAPGFNIGKIGDAFQVGEIDNPYADRIGDVLAQRNARIDEIMSSDPLGQFFDSVRSNAIANSLAKVGEESDKTSDKVRGLTRAFNPLAEQLRFTKDLASGFIGDLKSGLQSGEGIWASFANAATNALDKIANKLLDSALDSLLGPLFGNFFPGVQVFPSGMGLWAKGGAFDHGNVVPFARGGVVTRPTVFPMANGAGLMGEAGPEGILPLRRGRGGRLGVEVAGGDSRGSSYTDNRVFNIDARGAQQGVGEEIRAAIEAYDRDVAPRRAVSAVNDYVKAGNNIGKR